MTMHKYFEDIHALIKEQSCVAELIALEALKLTQRVCGPEERNIDGELLRTLTVLVVNELDMDEIKVNYQQNERQKAVKQQIDQSVQRLQSD